MADRNAGFERILIATDFSPASKATLQQALWVGRQSHARLVLAHVIEDLHQAAHRLSYKAKCDLLSGPGTLADKEIRYASDQKMKHEIASLNASDVVIHCETLLGEAFVELIHAVQQEGYDLVMTGTRGLSAWKQFFVGSTARKLIRNCPGSVWIVKEEHAGIPKVILSPTDFSDVSLKAVRQGLWLAEQSGAEFHLLHVIDSRDVPEDLAEHVPDGSSLRAEINREATQRLDEFVSSLGPHKARIHAHLTWGHPWQEIGRIAEKHHTDLITIGTVGRSGVRGILLGNTAERVLDTCDCSVLTVKPDDFESPVARPEVPLHP